MICHVNKFQRRLRNILMVLKGLKINVSPNRNSSFFKIYSGWRNINTVVKLYHPATIQDSLTRICTGLCVLCETFRTVAFYLCQKVIPFQTCDVLRKCSYNRQCFESKWEGKWQKILSIFYGSILNSHNDFSNKSE